MQDYEMYDGDIKKGFINIYWDNINTKFKNGIIDSSKDKQYRVVSIEEDLQKYELSFDINDVDDIYDIVSKYISDDKDRFQEIDKIKEYNNIKTIKKPMTIKLLLHKSYLKYFNKSLKNVDKNSLVNSKIYFIKKVCEINKLNEIKEKLNNEIKHFNNIISSNEYAFYENSEKDIVVKKAIEKLNKLINEIEDVTEYKYGKDFVTNIKIN